MNDDEPDIYDAVSQYRKDHPELYSMRDRIEGEQKKLTETIFNALIAFEHATGLPIEEIQVVRGASFEKQRYLLGVNVIIKL